MTLFARYYRVLTGLSTRFGEAVEENDSSVEFVWRDAFKPSDKGCTVRSTELLLERASVLYNVAAAVSYAGTTQNRAEHEGLRRACQLFQQAAGALEQLASLLAKAPSLPLSTDLAPAAVGGWRLQMLAQAQQCFYEKAVLDQMKPAVVSKIAAQVGTLCAEAAASVRARELKGAFEKPNVWPATFEWQGKLHEAWAQYHAAQAHEDAYEYGAQVCRLEAASASLSDLVKACKHAPVERQSLYADALAQVSTRLAHATKLNSTVYTERVPPLASLPAIEPKSIVKPAAVPELQASVTQPSRGGGGAAGQDERRDDDLFAQLVPLTVLQASLTCEGGEGRGRSSVRRGGGASVGGRGRARARTAVRAGGAPSILRHSVWSLGVSSGSGSFSRVSHSVDGAKGWRGSLHAGVRRGLEI